MKAEKNFRSKDAILVKAGQLGRFDKFLSQNFDKISYSVRCSDETEITFLDFNELVMYENPSFKKIEAIDIYCRKNNNTDIVLSLNLGQERYSSSSTLSYLLKYDDIIWGISFEKELSERLKELKPWYWRISRFSFETNVLKIMAMIFGITLNYLMLLILYQQPGATPSSFMKNNLLVYTIVISIFWLIVFKLLSHIDKIKNYCYPLIAFPLGSQEANFETRQMHAKWFGSVVLAIVLGIISSMIYALFT